jgi:hypothetical protein
MATSRKLLIAVGATLGSCVLLCVVLLVGTTALSAVGILPTPEPTTARTPNPTKTPGPTPTPAQFIHDPTKRPDTLDRFTLLVNSAHWTNRTDLPARSGERYLILSVQVGANQRASKKNRGGTVYESSFRLVVGEQELQPDKAAREIIGSRGFGDTLGTSIKSWERRTLVFAVPDNAEQFQLHLTSRSTDPVTFTLRLPAAGAPLPSDLPDLEATPTE